MSGKVIIGYEPTPQGDDALALGGLFAEILAATPLIATVLSWRTSMIGKEDLERALQAETSEPLAAASESLRPLQAQTKAVAHTSPASALFGLAEAEQAVLVVVGSTHHGPAGRVLPGKVAESLLHGAPCAVAVAPKGFAGVAQLRPSRIGVAFDGSAEAWAALETAIGLAERTRGSLTLMTVTEPPGYGMATSMAILTSGELHDLELQENKRIQQLAAHRVPAGIQVERVLLSGDPGPALAEAAAGQDILVTGSRGYGPLRRTILGSTSAKLFRSSACPVLVLPRGAGVDPLHLGSRPSLAAVS